MSLGGLRRVCTQRARRQMWCWKVLYTTTAASRNWTALLFLDHKERTESGKQTLFLPRLRFSQLFPPPPPALLPLPLCLLWDVVKALFFFLGRGFSNLSMSLLLDTPIHSLCFCVELTQTAMQLVTLPTQLTSPHTRRYWENAVWYVTF